MGNIIDYLKWRGDLTFQRDDFCEVDNLLLSYLSYVNLDGIAPGEGEGFLTLKEVSDAFFQRYSEEELKKDRSFKGKQQGGIYGKYYRLLKVERRFDISER